MSYIGGKPSKELASPTSQYFNGTGSATVFTLDRPVNVSEDLEVFVNNIQQEPGVGKSYTATGTTLTFDAAPSSGTGNVYVVYRGLAEVTTRLEHDPNAALAATTGTFSGDLTVDTDTLYVDSANDKVGINGAPVTSGSALPFLDVHGGQAEHGILIRTGDTNVAGGGGSVLQFGFNTNASYRHNVRTRHDSAVNANNAIEFYTWNTAQNSADLGNRKVLSVTDVGVTMPYQPAFWAYLSGNWTSWTPNNQTQVVPFDQAYHNIGNNFNGSNGLFTCPVAGNYVFTCGVYVGVTSVEQLWLVKNGVRQPTLAFANAGTSGDRSVGTFILRCAANDTIGLCPYAGPSTTSTVFANFFHSFFMGNLIG